jgi:hypothetical protein
MDEKERKRKTKLIKRIQKEIKASRKRYEEKLKKVITIT